MEHVWWRSGNYRTIQKQRLTLTMYEDRLRSDISAFLMGKEFQIALYFNYLTTMINVADETCHKWKTFALNDGIWLHTLPGPHPATPMYQLIPKCDALHTRSATKRPLQCKINWNGKSNIFSYIYIISGWNINPPMRRNIWNRCNKQYRLIVMVPLKKP